MDDLNLTVLEAWFRLLAGTARGTREAQSTIRSLAEEGLSADNVARQIGRWLPSGVAPPTPETIRQWAGDLWAVSPVVPRARYAELLERYDALRARLEEAEVTIQRLRAVLSEKGHEDEARNLLDLWSGAVTETLKTQADWMRTLVGAALPTGAPPTPRKPRA